MKTEKLNDDYLWSVLYNMNGFGLIDYLNRFDSNNIYKTSQHGGYIFRIITNSNYTSREIFDDFSKWRETVSYYFNGFYEQYTDIIENQTEENFLELFVLKVVTILGVLEIDDITYFPEDYESFLFC